MRQVTALCFRVPPPLYLPGHCLHPSTPHDTNPSASSEWHVAIRLQTPFTMSVVLNPQRGPIVLTPISISPESRYLTLAVSDGGRDELVSLSPEQRVIFDLGQLPENHTTWVEARGTMTYGQFKEQNTFRMSGVKLHETDNLICDKQTGKPKVDENGQPTGQKWHTLAWAD